MIREFPSRMDKLHKVMERKELDALLLANPQNVYYVSGFSAMNGQPSVSVLLPHDGEPSIVLPSVELDRVRETSWITNIKTYSPYSPAPQTEVERSFASRAFITEIKRLIESGSLSSATIGIEFSQITVSFFEALRASLEKTGFKDISGDILEVRSVKDYEEIETIRDSLEISERGIRTAIELIQPGITELEVAAEVERTMRKAGSRGTAFDSVIASGPRSGDKLASAKQKKIDMNEFVAIDVSAIYNEYRSEVARTIYTGKPEEKHKRIFELSKRTLTKTIEQIRPGITSEEIVIPVRSFVKDLAAEGSIEVSGHGIGLDLYEYPRILENEIRIIKPGMVICVKVETSIRDIGGLRIEETVLVTDDGQEVLNKLPIETV
jgi:Xaa-Pro aminopeptidase